MTSYKLKTYREYISRGKKPKEDTYISQDEYDSYSLYHVNIDVVMNEVKTKNVKT